MSIVPGWFFSTELDLILNKFLELIAESLMKFDLKNELNDLQVLPSTPLPTSIKVYRHAFETEKIKPWYLAR
jgi:hypothetical protein